MYQREIMTAKRPPFGMARCIEWSIWPLLNAVLGRVRLSNGSYPAWVTRLPNGLTMSRLLAFPVAAGFGWAAMAHQPGLAAAGLVAIGLLYFTDAVDGAIARFIGAESAWGMKWDPILDKLAGIAMFSGWLILVRHFEPRYFPWFLGLVTLRVLMDVALFGIALREDSLGLKPKARMWGKLKATCDDLAVIAGYAGATASAASHSGTTFTLLGGCLLVLACMLAPLSIYEHAVQLRRH